MSAQELHGREPRRAGPSPTVTGSCLCGEVRYELDREPPPPVHCHCRYCRRAHGAPFVPVSPLPREALRWLSGQDRVRDYVTRGGGRRSFCSNCGTRLFNSPRRFPALISLVVGTLDEEPDGRPSAHINLESKAPWYEIHDSAPRFERLPR